MLLVERWAMETDLAALEAMPMPRSKAELTARIPPARAALESAIGAVSDARMTTPGSEGWAVTDHLAHLATWEQMIVAHLTDGSDHEIVGLDHATYAGLSLDALNTVIERQNKGRSPGDVREGFRRSHAAMLALLDQLTDDDLARPYWDDDPSRRPVIEKFAGDTYRHYLEHRRWILDLIEQISKAEP